MVHEVAHKVKCKWHFDVPHTLILIGSLFCWVTSASAGTYGSPSWVTFNSIGKLCSWEISASAGANCSPAWPTWNIWCFTWTNPYEIHIQFFSLAGFLSVLSGRWRLVVNSKGWEWCMGFKTEKLKKCENFKVNCFHHGMLWIMEVSCLTLDCLILPNRRVKTFSICLFNSSVDWHAFPFIIFGYF